MITQQTHIKCACGCGQSRLKYDKKGREREYIYGHTGTFGFKKGHDTWNKGKTKENDKRLVSISKKLSIINRGKLSPKKGKTYEKMYGVDKANQLRNNHSKLLKGKSFEEKYGKEEAERKKKCMSNLYKGKTYEEIYGEERAKIIKERHSEGAMTRLPALIREETMLSKCFHFLIPKRCSCGCGKEIIWKSYWQYTHVNFIYNHHRKNKTYEEIFGVEKAKEMKKEAKARIKGKTHIEMYGEENARIRGEEIKSRLKGKTWEELYGVIKANQMKQKIRNHYIGKTYEELYGEDEAKLRKSKLSKSLKGRSYEQVYGKDVAKRMRLGKVEWRSKAVWPKKDTKIEVKIQDYLKELGITFFTHQYMDIEHAYQCDILIPCINLVIECDGDYWHKYPIGNELDRIRTEELIKKGFKVLRLWGNEINGMSIDKFKEDIEIIKNSQR